MTNSFRSGLLATPQIMEVRVVRSIFILVSTGVICYILWALCSPIKVKSVQKPETLPEPISVAILRSDIRALLPSTEAELHLINETTQCGHNFHIKSRKVSDTITHHAHRLIVMESRKALYCYIGRLGSSRWKRLALKAEGVASYLVIPKDKLGKMLAIRETYPQPFICLSKSSFTQVFVQHDSSEEEADHQ